jgi:pimeloyl-ACP methyl ester carboxylesterase
MDNTYKVPCYRRLKSPTAQAASLWEEELATENSERVKAYRPIEALIPAHWRRGQFAARDGAELSYGDTGGAGAPVVLLHGFQSAGLMWLRTAMALEGTHRVLMPDFRGHGYSHASLDGFSLERLAEDTANMIDALGLGAPALVGHSLGAEVAGRVAAEYPALVRSVVLVDPPMRAFQIPPSPSGELPPWIQEWLSNMKLIRTQAHPERLQTALQLMPPGAPAWPEADMVAYAEACAQLNLGVLRIASSMPYSVATPEVAGRIQAPLLLLTGSPQRGSGAAPEGIATLLDGERREHVAFDDAGHFIPIDQFERFIAVLRAFLARA